MIKRFKKRQDQKRFYRTNERIFASTLRVLGSDGKQIGVISRIQALTKSRELGLDLVEIAPNAQPPVAKIIDFKKFLYQEEKKKREERKKTKSSDTKEVRFGPFMDDHDRETMTRRAREFLGNNDKVKMVVKFIGRQITHPEFGYELTKKVISELSDIAKIEREPRFEGKQLITIVSPERKKKNDKDESQKIAQQEI